MIEPISVIVKVGQLDDHIGDSYESDLIGSRSQAIDVARPLLYEACFAHRTLSTENVVITGIADGSIVAVNFSELIEKMKRFKVVSRQIVISGSTGKGRMSLELDGEYAPSDKSGR